MEDKEVLVSASIYKQKYFLNKKFKIPKEVLEELRVICITLSAKLHCIFSIGFYKDGRLYFESKAYENDFNYDEIGAKLEIQNIIKKEKNLISSLEIWYKVFVLKNIEK